jgi:hypothetical protein
MTDLLLEIESVVNMDLERAAAVGRAFDEDPELRLLRVGGDPARLSVESTLGNLIRQTGLPIDWLTVEPWRWPPLRAGGGLGGGSR